MWLANHVLFLAYIDTVSKLSYYAVSYQMIIDRKQHNTISSQFCPRVSLLYYFVNMLSFCDFAMNKQTINWLPWRYQHVSILCTTLISLLRWNQRYWPSTNQFKLRRFYTNYANRCFMLNRIESNQRSRLSTN